MTDNKPQQYKRLKTHQPIVPLKQLAAVSHKTVKGSAPPKTEELRCSYTLDGFMAVLIL